MLKNFSCGPEISIDGPVTPIEYTGLSNIADALGFINLSIMAPHVFPQALSNVSANDGYKLSTRNKSGVFYFSTFSLLFFGRKSFGTKITPVPATIIISWDFMLFYVIRGPQFKTV